MLHVSGKAPPQCPEGASGAPKSGPCLTPALGRFLLVSPTSVLNLTVTQVYPAQLRVADVRAEHLLTV